MQKNIGIWGFGIVGKSILRFLKETLPFLQKSGVNCGEQDFNWSDLHVYVWDEREISKEEIAEIKRLGAYYIETKELLDDFLAVSDYVLVSPGVDCRDYEEYENKFICELDLFSKYFHKPTVAFTGTLGKTTIASVIYHIVNSLALEDFSFFNKDQNKKGKNQKYSVSLGGNIGRGLLDLVKDREKIDLAILEISSFQLERSRWYAPDIAVWTNFYPNHLNRHETIKNYFEAKWKLLAQQTGKQVVLLPVSLFEAYENLDEKISSLKSQICFVSSRPLTSKELERVKSHGGKVFFAKNDCLYFSSFVSGSFIPQKIAMLQYLPKVSFFENWIIILSTVYLLRGEVGFTFQEGWYKNISRLDYEVKGADQNIDSHRMELFATVNGIDFYNDSKATVIQATQAAFDRLIKNDRPVILIVGGQSKGVDRSSFLAQLSKVSSRKLKKVFYLSKKSDIFQNYKTFDSLEKTVKEVMKVASPGDQILFSPGGSSFDLFENYKHRGNLFKELVRSYARKKE